MSRVALFHTGGHTEMGALQQALRAALGEVEIRRCFPARDRRGPMPRARAPGEAVVSQLAPRKADEGATGADLLGRIQVALVKYPPEPGELVLIVDDADCRMCPTDSERAEERRLALHAELRAAVVKALREANAPEVPVCVILAREEIEAWLLADWANTFAAEYPGQHPAVRYALSQALPDALQAPESVGCPLKTDGQGCKTKVSEEIQAVVRAVPPLLYSKATHGQAMLRRVNLDNAARRCPTLRADLTELRAALGARG